MTRVAEPDDEIPKINPSGVEILIERVKQNKLDARETGLIAGLPANPAVFSRDVARQEGDDPSFAGNDLRPTKRKEEKSRFGVGKGKGSRDDK